MIWHDTYPPATPEITGNDWTIPTPPNAAIDRLSLLFAASTEGSTADAVRCSRSTACDGLRFVRARRGASKTCRGRTE
jgi:hypothetical protein